MAKNILNIAKYKHTHFSKKEVKTHSRTIYLAENIENLHLGIACKINIVSIFVWVSIRIEAILLTSKISSFHENEEEEREKYLKQLLATAEYKTKLKQMQPFLPLIKFNTLTS